MPCESVRWTIDTWNISTEPDEEIKCDRTICVENVVSLSLPTENSIVNASCLALDGASVNSCSSVSYYMHVDSNESILPNNGEERVYDFEITINEIELSNAFVIKMLVYRNVDTWRVELKTEKHSTCIESDYVVRRVVDDRTSIGKISDDVVSNDDSIVYIGYNRILGTLSVCMNCGINLFTVDMDTNFPIGNIRCRISPKQTNSSLIVALFDRAYG